MKTIDVSNLNQLQEFAKVFSQGLQKGNLIFLQGDLGCGKTTFVQYVLQHLGYTKRVKSPTYAIYEQYAFDKFIIYHMDLYRLSEAQELYYLGIEEILSTESIVFIEWPEKGKGVLPDATHTLHFALVNSSKREITLDNT